MAYTIANSSSRNDYFNNAGTAISANVQPNPNGSAFVGIRDASITHDAANAYGLISVGVNTPGTGYDNADIIMGLTNSIKGVDNTALRSPGSEMGRESIHQLDALRTFRVASGIR